MAEAAVPAVRSVKARLARGAAHAFLINIFGTGLAFLSQLVLARVLGVEGYGIYAYVIAWITVLALLATLGFQTGMLRFAAAYRAREEWGLLRGVIRYATGRVSLAGLATGLLTAGVVVALGDRLAPELAGTFLVGCAMLPFLSLLQVSSSTVRALGGVVLALAPQALVRPAVMLLGIGIATLAFSFAFTPPTAMAVMLIATMFGLGMVGLALRRLRPHELATAGVAYKSREWRRTSLTLLAMTATRVLLSRVDILMLGLLADTTSVGIYAVASRVTDLVAFALAAINTIFAPNIAALHARSDRPALQALVTTTAWWAMLSGLLIAVPLFALTELVLSIFGEAFTAGTVALRILLLGQIVNAAAGSVGPLLTMTGHERQATIVMAMATLAVVALDVVLIPQFGLVGAAVAATLAQVGWNLAFAVLVWRKLAIVPSVFGRR